MYVLFPLRFPAGSCSVLRLWGRAGRKGRDGRPELQAVAAASPDRLVSAAAAHLSAGVKMRRAARALHAAASSLAVRTFGSCFSSLYQRANALVSQKHTHAQV